MKRETSVSGGEGNFRARMHLQFFADAEGGGDFGAIPDDGDAGSFTEGLENDRGQDQPVDETQTGEAIAGGAADQRADGLAEPPEQNEQIASERALSPPVRLTYNGTSTNLPRDAVRAVADSLGGGEGDVIALLQKGMNYENKASREVRILDEYASAAGMDKAAYLQQLEQGLQTARLQSETGRVLEQYPGMAQQTAENVAKQRISDAEQAHRQELLQSQQRVQQTIQEVRMQAQMQVWDAYEAVSGVHRPEDIPPRVMELVQSEGMDPTAAHWRFESEQRELLLQNEQKMKQNRKTSAGSQRGAASDFADAFLTGLLD